MTDTLDPTQLTVRRDPAGRVVALTALGADVHLECVGTLRVRVQVDGRRYTVRPDRAGGVEVVEDGR